MILLGAVFLVLFVIFGAVLLPLLSGGEKRRRLAEVERYRLTDPNQESGGTPGGALGRTALAVTEQVVRSGGWEQRFVVQLDRAGMKLRPHEWVLLRTLIGVGVTILFVFLFGLIGLPFGVLFGWVVTAAYHRSRARRRSDKFA